MCGEACPAAIALINLQMSKKSPESIVPPEKTERKEEDLEKQIGGALYRNPREVFDEGERVYDLPTGVCSVNADGGMRHSISDKIYSRIKVLYDDPVEPIPYFFTPLKTITIGHERNLGTIENFLNLGNGFVGTLPFRLKGLKNLPNRKYLTEEETSKAERIPREYEENPEEYVEMLRGNGRNVIGIRLQEKKKGGVVYSWFIAEVIPEYLN